MASDIDVKLPKFPYEIDVETFQFGTDVRAIYIFLSEIYFSKCVIHPKTNLTTFG